MPRKLSKDAAILQNRSAFSLYLKKGIEAVEKLYPESLVFVKRNKGKSLKEVTEILTEKLNSQSERLIPLSTR